MSFYFRDVGFIDCCRCDGIDRGSVGYERISKEVRDKMLSVLPHAEIVHTTAPISDWQALAKTVASKIKEIIGAAPYVRSQGAPQQRSQH